MSHIDQIPQLLLRLAGLRNLPALPIDLPEMMESVPKLLGRLIEEKKAKDGLSNEYTIAGETAEGRDFLFGEGLGDRLKDALEEIHQALDSNPTRVLNRFYKDFLDADESADISHHAARLTALPLDTPDQWSISWTNFQNVYENARPKLARWAATMTDPDTAEEQFWSTFAKYGVGYNLLVLKKLTVPNAQNIRRTLGSAWMEEHQNLLEDGLLYAIDMSVFEKVKSNKVDGLERFTPASITLLEQDTKTKKLKPILIRVARYQGADAQVYTRAVANPSVWLYAMLAAKTGITVHGIWLGHVYQWHIVTAAMQMTMYNELPKSHPVFQILAPQSKYQFGFDDILLLLWKHIAPPTSITTASQFLELINEFAHNRPFTADDPKTAIGDLGLKKENFTVEKDWDQYPIVGYYLEIWNAAEVYVNKVVCFSYGNDSDVQNDGKLQKWLSESRKRHEGNVQGLSKVEKKSELMAILTSLIYRITIHGVSRMGPTANPAMTFVPNFPPCLQNSAIPDPQKENFNTGELLSFLPRTGTIGAMMTFYFTFAFSTPYKPFIPVSGVDTDLFYPGGPDEPRNCALIEFRKRLECFIKKYQPTDPQFQQWPLNIET